MPNGHHGANHPVQDLKTGVVMITSQNLALPWISLPATCVRHTVAVRWHLQGIERTDKVAFSFQGHPEASLGRMTSRRVVDVSSKPWPSAAKPAD